MRAIISSSPETRSAGSLLPAGRQQRRLLLLRLTFAVFFYNARNRGRSSDQSGWHQTARRWHRGNLSASAAWEACCHDSLGMMRGVNAHNVQQICRTHRPAKLFFHHFVDLAEIRAVAQQLAETRERKQHAWLTKNPGQSLTTIGVLPILLAQATTFSLMVLSELFSPRIISTNGIRCTGLKVHSAEVFDVPARWPAR